MRIYPNLKTGFRWLAGAAAVASVLAIAGLVPAASAQAGQTAPGKPGSASAVAALGSTCRWAAVPASLWIVDPAASPIGMLWGNYARPGQKGVAYKVTGQFAHSTTQTFTSYNNVVNIVSPAYVLDDKNVIPDKGSVNPFVPGTRVEGTPRNYTVWMWPAGIPVPSGLKNVVLYPTKPQAGTISPRWLITLRLYHMQPGFSAKAAFPKVTAMSARTLRPVRCPITKRGAVASQIKGFFAHKLLYGTLFGIPEPKTGNTVYFTRFPTALGAGLDGYPGPVLTSCANYVTGQVPLNKISVITTHAVPEFFNNDLVTPASIMKDYPIRYQSLTISAWTFNQKLYNTFSINTDDAVYTANGSWVTIYLPSEPMLPASQIAAIEALAKKLHFNVKQLPPKATGPLSSQFPDGWLVVRQKAISSSFPLSVKNVPCWAEHHDYKTWPNQSSPAFFAKYASNRRNMGPYYIDGVKLDFPQFMAKFSAK